MSKKNLLNEGTIRRFMKLAEIEPLTDQFVGKINEADMKKDDKDDKVKEGMYGKKDDKKIDEEMHADMKDEMEEGMGMSYTDDPEADGVRDMMEEDYLDEDDFMAEPSIMAEEDAELEELLAELDLDFQADEEEPEAMEPGMDPEAMGAETPALEDPAEPAMGGMDPEAMADLVKDAVMEALQDLVDDGKISVEDEESEEVKVSDASEEDEDEEKMVNEVARRVMKRIANSRR